jgi:hypothetical protein
MKREIVGVPRERITMHAPGVVGSVTPRSVEELVVASGGGASGEGGSATEGIGGGKSASGEGAQGGTDGATANVQVEQPSWLQNVKNAIPVEILVVWAAIESAPGVSDGTLGTPVFVAIFGVMCVVTALYMWTNVKSPSQAMAERRDLPTQYLRHSQYAQILLAVGGFAAWTYYLGGPFTASYTGLYHPTYATILLPLYVGLGPKLVPDLLRKLHGVEIPDERQRAPDEFLRAESESE